jgi:uncharacterized protein (TIGR02996 family)
VIADSLQAAALHEYICQHPAEDDARLVYADVLEERGEDERAEFIRVGVELAGLRSRITDPRDNIGLGWSLPKAESERVLALDGRERELLEAHFAGWAPQLAGEDSGYLLPSEPTVRIRHNERYDDDVAVTFHRGFPAEVTLTAEAFAGGRCGRCEGSGKVLRGLQGVDEDQWREHDCPNCRGTGQTPGHAAVLFRAAPIERVTLSDREPADGGEGIYPSESWYWEESAADFWFLPRDLFDLLTGHRRASQRTDLHPSRQRHYDTEQDAHDALAAAALLYGRRRGWPCPRCQATGKLRFADMEDEEPDCACSSCHGTGHTVEES